MHTPRLGKYDLDAARADPALADKILESQFVDVQIRAVRALNKHFDRIRKRTLNKWRKEISND